MNVIQCKGEGQGSCALCSAKGKWNRSWMCFLYKVDKLPGIYCSECIKEIEKDPTILLKYKID